MHASHIFSEKQALPIIDVRAPLEFNHGHIPHAHNIPLFNNEDRAHVGTLYKKYGKEEAIKAGFALVAPHITTIIEQIKLIAPNKELIIHCARGGMRSASVAHLVTLFGFKAHLIAGGYKAYKKEVRDILARPYQFVVLGGMTGSGKTDILKELAQRNHQVLNIEAHACHKGSVFGASTTSQPTQEQFMNNLAHTLADFSTKKTIFVEDESNKIGSLCIPEALWKTIRTAPVHIVERTREERIAHIINEYGTLPVTTLCQGLDRLTQFLGSECTRRLKAEVLEHNFSGIDHLLTHYDKAYKYSLSRRAPTIIGHTYLPHGTISDYADAVERACISR